MLVDSVLSSASSFVLTPDVDDDNDSDEEIQLKLLLLALLSLDEEETLRVSDDIDGEGDISTLLNSCCS